MLPLNLFVDVVRRLVVGYDGLFWIKFIVLLYLWHKIKQKASARKKLERIYLIQIMKEIYERSLHRSLFQSPTAARKRRNENMNKTLSHEVIN